MSRRPQTSKVRDHSASDEEFALLFKHIIVEYKQMSQSTNSGVSGLAAPGRVLLVLGEGRESLLHSLAHHLHCLPRDRVSAHATLSDAGGNTGEAVYLLKRGRGYHEAKTTFEYYVANDHDSSYPVCDFSSPDSYDVFPRFSKAEEIITDAAKMCPDSFLDWKSRDTHVRTVLDTMSLGNICGKIISPHCNDYASKDRILKSVIMTPSESRCLSVATQLVSARPKVLLLPEVTKNLSLPEAHHVLVNLARHVEAHHHTVVVSMQDYPLGSTSSGSPLFASNVDALILGARGRVVFLGPIDDLAQHFSTIGYSKHDKFCICCQSLDPISGVLRLINLDEMVASKFADAFELSQVKSCKTSADALAPKRRELKKCNSKIRELPIPRSCQTSHSGMDHPLNLIFLLAAGNSLPQSEDVFEDITRDKSRESQSEDEPGSPMFYSSDPPDVILQPQIANKPHSDSAISCVIPPKKDQSSARERKFSPPGPVCGRYSIPSRKVHRRAAQLEDSNSRLKSPMNQHQLQSKSITRILRDTSDCSSGYPFSDFLSSTALSASESASSEVPGGENTSLYSPDAVSSRHFSCTVGGNMSSDSEMAQSPTQSWTDDTDDISRNTPASFLHGSTASALTMSSQSRASPGTEQFALPSPRMTQNILDPSDCTDDQLQLMANRTILNEPEQVHAVAWPELGTEIPYESIKKVKATTLRERGCLASGVCSVVMRRAMRAATRDFWRLPVSFLSGAYFLLLFGARGGTVWVSLTRKPMYLAGYGLVCGFQGIKTWHDDSPLMLKDIRKGFYSIYTWALAQVVSQSCLSLGFILLPTLTFSVHQQATLAESSIYVERYASFFLNAWALFAYAWFMRSCGCICLIATASTVKAYGLFAFACHTLLFPLLFMTITWWESYMTG